jgi:hypothetical protein
VRWPVTCEACAWSGFDDAQLIEVYRRPTESA